LRSQQFRLRDANVQQTHEGFPMRNFPRSLIGTAIAAVLAVPSVSWSQSADATLRGSAPADTEITAKNVATGTTRRTRAGADGSYTLAGLPPGTYRVDAGPGTETVVTLTVASTATLDLRTSTSTAVETDAPMQEVTVTGRRLNEVRTSEVGTTVSRDQITNVPQMTRNFLEFADTVPGVVFTVDGKGKTSIRGGAQGNNGVNLYIDGVGQKGYVRSGVSGQAGDTQGNPFPQLAIGEYKVITSNYKAEYDQISSAAITALTRSGTNELKVEAFGTYTADNFRARTPGEIFSREKAESESKEYGIAIGGPIIQDRLHYFLTYEGKRYQTPTTVTFDRSPPPGAVEALPPDVLAQFGARDILFEEDLFFVKLDWALTDSDSLQFSVKIREETSFGDQTGTGVAASAAIDTDNSDKRYELSWKHDGSSWLNEVQATYEDAFFVPHVNASGENGAQYTYISGADNPRIISVNAADPRASQNKGQKGWSIGDTITFTDINWFGGDHTIKAGIKYKSVELTAADSIAGNPVFFYDTTAAGAAPDPWKAAFALPFAGFDSQVTSQDKQLGIFVQDDWTVNDHLTLNLGLRWDLEKNPSYLNFRTPQFVLDGLNEVIDTATGLTYGESLALSSDPNTAYDINDYVSTGNNRKPVKDAFQPRLGFSYDIGADQQHVIFGGAGRAYDRTLYDYLQLEQTKFALATTEVRFNTPDHPCDTSVNNCLTWDPAFAADPNALAALFSGSAGEINLMNNDLKIPYSDQFSLGMRNRVGDWNTSAAVSRIFSKDGFVFSLGHRAPDGSFWQGRDLPWGFHPSTITGNMIIGDNGIETRSTQVLLSAEKPFTEESRWGTSISYTFTDASQNRDILEHYAFAQVSIKEYRFVTSNAVARHRLVATGTYSAPWGLLLAGKYTLSSPIPRTVDSCLLPPAVFDNGAPCQNFTYTVDDKGYRALDLQVTKNFAFGDIGSLYLRLDALNVTNARNLVDFADRNSQDGTVAGGRFNRNGNITGVPRTLRMSFGVKF
jgi:outer membrane receptor protein involved in Fe transport